MPARRIGDYQLNRLLRERGSLRIWSAQQVSIQRRVIVTEVFDLRARESFLAAVRAKAAVDHPLIGSVYEAVDEPDHCFAAFERLPGKTLAEHHAEGDLFEPVDIARLLRRLADAMSYLDKQGVATEQLAPGHIHVDPGGHVRLENVARVGPPDPEAPTSDIRRLGSELPEVLAERRPGARRVLALLASMRGDDTDVPLSWEDIRSAAEQLEARLLDAQPCARTQQPRLGGKRRSYCPVLAGMLGGIALLFLLIAALASRTPREATPLADYRPESITIPAALHPTPDGDVESLAAFRIATREVTIGEYLEFLEVLERLDPKDRDVFDLDRQPREKTGHKPDDWTAMLAAARSGGTWRNRPVSLEHPITNIDWWDAAAYAEWRGARLPTQEEWFAALSLSTDEPADLPPAGWCRADEMSADRTDSGLLGMAGSVSEWTGRPAINPANPAGPKAHVIIGGSWKHPQGGALARQWTGDPMTRRPDLGIRLVHRSETAP